MRSVLKASGEIDIIIQSSYRIIVSSFHWYELRKRREVKYATSTAIRHNHKLSALGDAF